MLRLEGIAMSERSIPPRQADTSLGGGKNRHERDTDVQDFIREAAELVSQRRSYGFGDKVAELTCKIRHYHNRHGRAQPHVEKQLEEKLQILARLHAVA